MNCKSVCCPWRWPTCTDVIRVECIFYYNVTHWSSYPHLILLPHTPFVYTWFHVKTHQANVATTWTWSMLKAWHKYVTQVGLHNILLHWTAWLVYTLPVYMLIRIGFIIHVFLSWAMNGHNWNLRSSICNLLNAISVHLQKRSNLARFLYWC